MIRLCTLLPPLFALHLLLIGSAEPLRAENPSSRFTLCHGMGGPDCVVDGDTFWLEGAKIRIADIDTPETHGPRCSAEGALGMRATQRLLALLNAGTFSLVPVKRERDRYGRTLRIVTRQGQSIGALLVAEGLARPWTGARQPWCRS
ncbi:thermonuclease family protein [Sphingobium sp. Cam5-1]|uniref:thermonuclease family protein n=1 Tax=Sphingobium sp. Cam5-1 TaxID=2789327 RepID=UPI0018AD2764|nr:thermonuclease family protein [Sphingobium sp. Cam5-1]